MNRYVGLLAAIVIFGAGWIANDQYQSHQIETDQGKCDILVDGLIDSYENQMDDMNTLFGEFQQEIPPEYMSTEECRLIRFYKRGI